MYKNLTLFDRIIRSILAVFFLYWSNFEFNAYSIIGIFLSASALSEYCVVYDIIAKSKVLKNERFYLDQLPKLNPEPTFVFSHKGDIVFQNASSKIGFKNLNSFQSIFKEDAKDIIQKELFVETLYQERDDWFKMFAKGVRKNNYILVYGFNVNSLIQTQNKLQTTIITDGLTKIGNRKKLNQDVEKLTHSLQALACMDIMKFGEFNAFYGHNMGDILLKNFADYLEEFRKKSGNIFNIYRLNGNTFAVLFSFELSHYDSFKQEVTEQIEDFLLALKKKTFGNKAFDIGLDIRVGISMNTHISTSKKEAKHLILKAETALQESKTRDNSIVFYREIQGVEEQYNQHIIVSQKLKNILVHKNSEALITPFFQPIFSLKTKQIEKYEALARIQDGDTVIPPNHFLEAAKKLYLLPNITEQILTKSLETFAKTSYPFSINITTQDLENEKLIDFFETACKKFHIPHSQIVLEIVEDEDIYQLRDTIKALQIKGFSIAIDDFGVGYSNFKKLQDIKAEYIKIDGSLIKNINENSEDLQIVKSIALYAKSIGAKTIAEFVSNQNIYETLLHLDIDYAQGFYIGKPQPKIISDV